MAALRGYYPLQVIIRASNMCRNLGWISVMGLENFLVGSSSQTFGNIDDAVEKLRDASALFVIRMERGDMRRAGEISLGAFECFDHIVGELLRVRDDRMTAKAYSGTAFEQKMEAVAALMVEPVSLADQAAVALAGPGSGRLPAGKPTSDISLVKTLNKIKHRHQTNLNFRLEQGRHLFIVCPNRPNGIVEFDVAKFCDLCREASSTL